MGDKHGIQFHPLTPTETILLAKVRHEYYTCILGGSLSKSNGARIVYGNWRNIWKYNSMLIVS